MYYIFRHHIVPMDIAGSCLIVKQMYEDHFKQHRYLLTSFQMNKKIRRKWRRCDVWDERRICVSVPSSRHQLNAIQSESMDQYWYDMKPHAMDFRVSGALTFKQIECPICKDSIGHKIKLDHCKCIFHKKCIETAVKYRDRCPVCDCTINKCLVLKKGNATKTKATIT